MREGDIVRKLHQPKDCLIGTVMSQEGGHDRWLVRWARRPFDDDPLYEVAGGGEGEPYFCIVRGSWLRVVPPLELLAEQAP